MKITTRYHEDPSALHIGTEPSRAYYTPLFPDRKSRVIDLDGDWAFHYFDSYLDAVDMDGNVRQPEMCPIQVPSCWQCMGWGRHMYTNVRFPIPCDPPFVPEENPCGLYERRFELTPGESRFFLNFEGVDSCFYLWVNGEFQGYSQVSHSTSEFEITANLKDGENTISALVLQWCDGTYLEDQDKLRMSGIFRDVYILERPQAFLRDYFVKESFNDDFSKAEVKVELEASGSVELKAVLTAPDGTAAGEAGFSGSSGALSFSVDAPVLWNAENPRQYVLTLSTNDEIIEQKVGLRKIEIKDDVVYLNGVNIKFRGVNRHDSDPVTGYTISREQAIRDMLIMKQHNVNAIRTSHYPNAPWFNQLCSEFGFYVIGEADLESHGFATRYGGNHDMNTYPDAMDDPQFKEAIVDRSQRNVHRDKNDAAVVIWSLGNESGWGENGEAAGRWVKEYDPSRLLHYEGNMTYHKERKPDFSMIDLFSRMYAPTNEVSASPWNKKASIESYFSGGEIDENWNGRRPPFVLCEYIHAMGNGPGDAEDYQQLIMKHDGFVGGFVWEWCDHAVYGGQTPDNRPIYRYGGDHDEFPHDGNFCMDGLVYPDRTPHTGLIEFKNVIRPIRARKTGPNTFVLHNYRDFTDAKDFAKLRYEAMKDGKIVASGKLTMPSIAPHCEAEITVEGLPADGDSTVTFFYEAEHDGPFFPAGHQLGFDEIVLCEEKQPLPAPVDGSVAISETNRVIAVTGPGFRYELCKQTGLWNQLCYANKPLFTRPMGWNVFRAPLDNDQFISGKWKEAGLDRPTARVYSIKAENAANGSAVVTLEVGIAALIVSPFVKAKVVWTVDAGGNISCSMDCERDPGFGGFLPRFGMRMFMPKTFDAASYFGYGPFESYIDKHRASRLGVYASSVEDMTEHYLKPQENGSHCGCRWAKVTDGQFDLTASSPDTFSINVSNYTQEELTNTKHDYELTPADETVVCLDYKMSGVGSNSCGPMLLPQYQLNEEKFSFSFALTPSCK